MINDKCKKEVVEFIRFYHNPAIVVSQPMKSGYVTCIKPVPTICGAELHCNEDTKGSLIKLIGGTND